MPTAIDPVCKMEVDTENPPAKGEYQGITYYFCMPGCKERFMSNPDRFLKSTEAADMSEVKGWKKFFKLK